MKGKITFIKTLRFVWPVLRRFVKLSRRCRCCVLSEKYTKIGEDGLCSYCRDFSASLLPIDAASRASPAASAADAEQFDALIHSYTVGEGYHAALFLSGGKDSAYILHRLRETYPKLRVLCMIVNNGFMSDVSMKGAKRIAEKCETDLVIVNSYQKLFFSRLRSAFLNLNGQGTYGVIDKTDGETIFDIAKVVAQSFNIPLAISGLTWVQLELIFNCKTYEMQEPGQPHMLFPLAFWRPKEQEIRQYVRERELLPKGGDDPVYSNSDLAIAMSALDILNLGYCSFEPEFSQLIREGKADRRTWLYNFEMLEFGVKMGPLKEETISVLKRLDLDLANVLKGSMT